VDMLPTTVNVTLKMTYEFEKLTTTELVEIINYEKNITKILNFIVAIAPYLSIFEPTGKQLRMYVHTITNNK